MNDVLNPALHLMVWFVVLVAVTATVRGGARVWAQAREAWRDRAGRSPLGRYIPPPLDQPIALAPRGGWLRRRAGAGGRA